MVFQTSFGFILESALQYNFDLACLMAFLISHLFRLKVLRHLEIRCPFDCSTFLSKARFPSQTPRFVLIFSPVNFIQVSNPFFFRVLLPRLKWRSKSTLCLLENVLSKANRLINNHNLTKSLQVLSHRLLAGDLSIFYRYLNGHCSQEIREIIPVPLRCVRTTSSSTHSHPFQVSLPSPQTLCHKSSFIPRKCNFWNVLPSFCFPESFNLPSFKSKINKVGLISFFS